LIYEWQITYMVGSWTPVESRDYARENSWTVRAPTAADALTMFRVYAKTEDLKSEPAFGGAKTIAVIESEKPALLAPKENR
jgi:hypothetical protein